MEIKVYTVADLLSLVESDFFSNSPIIPISKHRAVSHYHNPCAQAKDKVLWLAFVEQELVAYRLVLPDVINSSEETIRMAWVSCVYVSPQHRGKGYGQQLTTLALEAWENRLMGTEFASASLAMYQKMGFRKFRTSTGFRGYMSLSLSNILPKRNARWQSIKPLLKLIDGATKFFQRLRFNIFPPQLNPKITLVESKDISAKTWDFIAPRQGKEFASRTQERLNWMLRLPWIILRSQDIPNDAVRFHFSSVADDFRQNVIKVFLQKTLVGVFIMQIRDNHLKIPYAYFDEEHTALMAELIRQKAIKTQINTFTVYHKALSTYFLTHPKSFFTYKKVERHYLYAQGIPTAYTHADWHIQDGIGDAGFT